MKQVKQIKLFTLCLSNAQPNSFPSKKNKKLKILNTLYN